jgi:DMSO reductase anchor subunit
VVGVYASARLYLVPARPAWNTPRTVVSFFATAVAMGPLVAFLAHGGDRMLLAGAGGGTVVQLALYQFVAASVAVRRGHEWTAFGTLLFRRFRWLLA